MATQSNNCPELQKFITGIKVLLSTDTMKKEATDREWPRILVNFEKALDSFSALKGRGLAYNQSVNVLNGYYLVPNNFTDKKDMLVHLTAFLLTFTEELLRIEPRSDPVPPAKPDASKPSPSKQPTTSIMRHDDTPNSIIRSENGLEISRNDLAILAHSICDNNIHNADAKRIIFELLKQASRIPKRYDGISLIVLLFLKLHIKNVKIEKSLAY